MSIFDFSLKTLYCLDKGNEQIHLSLLHCFICLNIETTFKEMMEGNCELFSSSISFHTMGFCDSNWFDQRRLNVFRFSVDSLNYSCRPQYLSNHSRGLHDMLIPST